MRTDTIFEQLQEVNNSNKHCQPTYAIDPLTRYFLITYPVPTDAPDEITVRASWSPANLNNWHPAAVKPFLSDTAERLTPLTIWSDWAEQGKINEKRAGGSLRTLCFNPYPQAQVDGAVDIDFRIRGEANGNILFEYQISLQADNTDVVYLEDWSNVFQRDSLLSGDHTQEDAHGWFWRTNLHGSNGATLGNSLFGRSPVHRPLPPLSYPLDLRGVYAIFVTTIPDQGRIRLRLSGDERHDALNSRYPHEEVLWRWHAMDRQHLVIQQDQLYTGYAPSQIDYVKLVPLDEALCKQLDAPFFAPRQKKVHAFYEPYSWAFCDEQVVETIQHRLPLVGFAEAKVDGVDIQIGRFGAKVGYESRIADQLVGATTGDPIGDVEHPQTEHVGLMQQFTNTLQAGLKYAGELRLDVHANFGATNCYPGSPLQGEFSRLHPQWMKEHALRYDVPEVASYILTHFREALEIGANNISIDFCRYPDGIDSIATATDFMRSLRQLTGEFSATRQRPIKILVRFPAHGVRYSEFFDYQTWVKEGLVDYLCPSNIQGRHLHFDIQPYLRAVEGSGCLLLPCVDGLAWGLEMPGPLLARAQEIYKQGADGIYIYQADAKILGRPDERRCVAMLGSEEAIDQWLQQEVLLRCWRSKGIYLNRPLLGKEYGIYERARVWLEGIEPAEVELYLDGKLTNCFTQPPYLLGTEERASDGIIAPGKHELLVKARDGDGWLAEHFTIYGAPLTK